METKISENLIEIWYRDRSLYYFLAAGILILLIGLFLFRFDKIPDPLKYIFTGFGFFFSLFALAFLFNFHTLFLEIDALKKELRLTEGKKTTVFPFSDFRNLILQRSVSTSKDSKPGQVRTTINRELLLERKSGSSLVLVKDPGNLGTLIHKVLKISDLKLILRSAPDKESAAFFRKWSDLGQAAGTEIPPGIGENRDETGSRIRIALPDSPAFTEEKMAGKTVFSWSNRTLKSLLMLMSGIAFLGSGFFLARHFDQSLMAGIFGVFLLFFLFALFSAFVARQRLEIGPEKVSFSADFFGKQTNLREIELKKIHSLRSELNKNSAPVLVLATEKGMKIFTGAEQPNPVAMLFNLTDYFLQIDVVQLSVAERLYIEAEILEKHRILGAKNENLTE